MSLKDKSIAKVFTTALKLSRPCFENRFQRTGLHQLFRCVKYKSWKEAKNNSEGETIYWY